ncbi:MAG: L-aspartate oxidase [Phycisphaerales bacterium]|nr:L-aspartate oxidase [Phycisphaerales bacterium]
MMHELFDDRRYLIPFRSILLPQIFTDTLVIGSGAAGLAAAIQASSHGDVILLSKSQLQTSNTAWAQGGIAAVLTEEDSASSHVEDTLAAGAGLCDVPTVERIIGAGPGAIERLLTWGFRVDRDRSDGGMELAREGGHSHRRIVHCDGDATGRELARCLIEQVRLRDTVRIFDHCFALDLITPSAADRSPCMGAVTYHPRYGLQMIWARATILASGGMGMVWRETTNPPVATGDGVAMAYRAGASLADLGFMQFHPTTLYIAGANRALISEAVRGEGAYLLDANGERFMRERHELAELAPRDVVSRSIVQQTARLGTPHVWLDARHIEGFGRRFPAITASLRPFGLDPGRDLIPVNPAAHYAIGGVRTDASGRSDVPGLYAVGEAASTGLHGANRLASNSLLEAVVMGRAAGEATAEMLSDADDNAWGVRPRPGPVRVISDIRPSEGGELDLTDVRSSVRSSLWRNVGIERTGSKLRDAMDMLDLWARYTLDKIFDEPEGWETQNMLLAGMLITRSATWREETRGCHTRLDFPEPSAGPPVHDLWKKGSTAPVEVPVEVRAEA